MFLRLKFTTLPPRRNRKDQEGRTADNVTCGLLPTRVATKYIVHEQTIEFDKRLSYSLTYTNANALDGIEHLQLFTSALHDFSFRP